MFEKEILDLGFKEDIKDVDYKLEFDNMVFLYIRHGSKMHYEYYGRNKLAHILHSDASRSGFIDMIQEYKSSERDRKIDDVLSIQKFRSI